MHGCPCRGIDPFIQDKARHRQGIRSGVNRRCCSNMGSVPQHTLTKRLRLLRSPTLRAGTPSWPSPCMLDTPCLFCDMKCISTSANACMHACSTIPHDHLVCTHRETQHVEWHAHCATCAQCIALTTLHHTHLQVRAREGACTKPWLSKITRLLTPVKMHQLWPPQT